MKVFKLSISYWHKPILNNLNVNTSTIRYGRRTKIHAITVLSGMCRPNSRNFTTCSRNQQINESMDQLCHPKKIAFFGTDRFSLLSLKCLLERKNRGLIDNIHIITSPQASPYPAVPKFCLNSNVPFDVWPLPAPLRGFDMGIVVSFGYLIPESIIKSFPMGMINVHGSLLPRWRGSSPIIHAILNDDHETGITIMKIKPHKFDVGEIIYQEKMSISSQIKSLELTHEMALLGAKCLQYCLNNLPQLLSEAKPQPSIGITSAPKIKKSDSEIIWEKMPPDLLYSMFKAFDDYYHLWTSWRGTRVKLKEMTHWSCDGEPFHTKQRTKPTPVFRLLKQIRSSTCSRSDSSIEDEIENDGSFNVPGQVLYVKEDNVLRVKCLNGFVDFKQISVKGKKTMTASEFSSGYLSKVQVTKRYFR